MTRNRTIPAPADSSTRSSETEPVQNSATTKDKRYRNRSLKVRTANTTRIVKDKYHWHFDKTIEKQVSLISLQGQWLQDAGFAPDSQVDVQVEPGRLVLTLKTENK